MDYMKLCCTDPAQNKNKWIDWIELIRENVIFLYVEQMP